MLHYIRQALSLAHLLSSNIVGLADLALVQHNDVGIGHVSHVQVAPNAGARPVNWQVHAAIGPQSELQDAARHPSELSGRDKSIKIYVAFVQ